MSKRRSFLFGALGVVGTLITTFTAFLLFLGGISGMGNETLLTLAMVVFALPFVLLALFGLIKVVVKVSEEQCFKSEVDADQTPREPLGIKTILKSCDNFYSTLARLLMEESNRRGGETLYPESAIACVRT